MTKPHFRVQPCTPVTHAHTDLLIAESPPPEDEAWPNLITRTRLIPRVRAQPPPTDPHLFIALSTVEADPRAHGTSHTSGHGTSHTSMEVYHLARLDYLPK